MTSKGVQSPPKMVSNPLCLDPAKTVNLSQPPPPLIKLKRSTPPPFSVFFFIFQVPHDGRGGVACTDDCANV